MAAVLLLLAACGSEPTAVHTRPEAGIEARRSTSGQLTVYMYGPNQVYEGECTSWSSRVSGGTAPYRYSWSGVITAYNEGDFVIGSIGEAMGTDHYISVDVTDANGNTGSGGMWVRVTGGAPGQGCS